MTFDKPFCIKIFLEFMNNYILIIQNNMTWVWNCDTTQLFKEVVDV